MAALSPPRTVPPSEATWPLFLALTVAYALITLCAKDMLLPDDLYFSSLSSRLSEEQITEVVAFNKQWAWVPYAVQPLLLFLKFVVIAGVLATGYYLLTNGWTFVAFFRVAVTAEFVMLVAAVVKFFWFSWLHPHYTLAELQHFSPLSLSSAFTFGAAESWLQYPGQVASLFEVAYWLVLITSAGKAMNLPWKKAARLVALSYGPALLLWVLLVMFVTVTVSS